jgi:hypothetical protein
MAVIHIDPSVDYAKDLKVIDGIIQPSREIWEAIYYSILNVHHGRTLGDTKRREKELYYIKNLTQDEIDELRANDQEVPLNFLELMLNNRELSVESSEGVSYFVPKNERFVKLNSNLTILGVDEKPPQDFVNMQTRGSLNKSILRIWINGKKVPDDKILCLVRKEYTDILVPDRYIYDMRTKEPVNPGETEIYIEKTEFTHYSYLERSYSNFSGLNLSITLSIEELDHNSLGLANSVQQMMVFINGEYVHPEPGRALSNPVNNIVTLSLNLQPVPIGVELEVIFDSSIRISKTISTINSNKHQMWINKNKTITLDPIHGIVPRENCYFFIGKNRIPPKLVTQIGRYNYEYRCPLSNSVTEQATVLVTELNIVQRTSKYIYGEDYYLENMVGEEGVHILLKDKELLTLDDRSKVPEKLLNATIDYKSIFSKSGQLFNLQKILTQNEVFNSITSSTFSKAVALLNNKDNKTLLRNFLEYFSGQEIYDIIDCEEDELMDNEYIDYSFREIIVNPALLPYEYTMDLNGVPTLTKIRLSGDSIIVSIPSVLLKIGPNQIHITKIKKREFTQFSYTIVRKNQIVQTGDKFVATTSIIPGRSKDETDYICLMPTTSDDYVLNSTVSPSSPYKGWINANPLSITTYGEQVIVTFEDISNLPDVICIMCTRFNLRREFLYSDILGATIKSTVFPLYFGLGDYALPIISKVKPRLYINDILVDESVYKILNNTSNAAYAHSALQVSQQMLPDDVFTLEFVNVSAKIIMERKQVKDNNKYALFYFKNITYPYSPKYIHLYINNKFIYPEDIEIITDKLIRCPNVQVPIKTVRAETFFGVGEDFLNKYININQYSEDYITWLNDQMTFATNDKILNPDADELELESNLLEWLKENPEVPHYDGPPEYLEWFEEKEQAMEEWLAAQTEPVALEDYRYHEGLITTLNPPPEVPYNNNSEFDDLMDDLYSNFTYPPGEPEHTIPVADPGNDFYKDLDEGVTDGLHEPNDVSAIDGFLRNGNIHFDGVVNHNSEIIYPVETHNGEYKYNGKINRAGIPVEPDDPYMTLLGNDADLITDIESGESSIWPEEVYVPSDIIPMLASAQTIVTESDRKGSENITARDIARRTEWIKARLEGIESLTDPDAHPNALMSKYENLDLTDTAELAVFLKSIYYRLHKITGTSPANDYINYVNYVNEVFNILRNRTKYLYDELGPVDNELVAPYDCSELLNNYIGYDPIWIENIIKPNLSSPIIVDESDRAMDIENNYPRDIKTRTDYLYKQLNSLVNIIKDNNESLETIPVPLYGNI